MAVKLNQQDLTFILKQIKIAEAHASGIKLTELRVDAGGNPLSTRSLYSAGGDWLGPADAPRAVPDPHTPYGLRTVDGTFNNIVPGRETWGASGQPMPQLFDQTFVNEQDGDSFDPDGPGPAPTLGNTNYGLPGSVVDSDPRTISNLVVDASLNNPAAIAAALRIAGSETIIADQRAITAAYEALQAAAPEDRDARQTALDILLDQKGITVTNGSIDVLNVAPDEGLSKPFNAWMTFFGQFFDHGLDLISKGGNGTVYIPLAADDPLMTHGVDGIAGNADDLVNFPQQQFMVLTRSTPVDGSQRNVTTPFVDQNQTYTSNPSHQVFLREYEMVGGRPVATGRLLGGADGGLATWADVKFQARTMLGIDLRDSDVSAVPQLLTDPYGAFIPAANGLPQVMAGVSPGPNGSPIYVSGTLAAPLVLSAIQLPPGTQVVGAGGVTNTIEAGETVGAARTFNAFLDDIAHNAVPGGVFDPDGPTVRDPVTGAIVSGSLGDVAIQGDADSVAGNEIATDYRGRKVAYDDELLDRHYITGDGRGNENIGLTTVHHIFHSEHNRQVEAQKLTILRDGDLAFVQQWLDAPITAANLTAIKAGLAASTDQAAFLASLEDGVAATGVPGIELDWNGERLFQAGRFATEMQYQHLVFEEFARKVQPLIDPFVFNSVTEINPAIFAEFANTVYRFGHSMLTENMPRLGADGQSLDTGLGLIESFLNPVLFDNDGTMSHDEGAAAIIRGMTIERGSEIDEFVVGALRNNLLGLPLDLPALNIARGRETGSPTLNEAREQLFAATGSTFLTPYTSWVEMAANLKNSMSVVNFIAAYGTHQSIIGRVPNLATADPNDTRERTSAEKRDAAMTLVFGLDATATPAEVALFADRLDYLNSRGSWAGRETGFNAVDLWIGGLAEKQMPFGGLLGSTFNAVFEAQMENLQDADRFYYLTRTQGQNFLVELEQNSFSKLMLANTSLAEAGPDGLRGTEDDVVSRHIGIDAFADYDFELEVNATNQADADPTGNDPLMEAMGLAKVMRDDPGTTAVESNYLRFTGGEHVLVGGTNGNDTIITDFGDDAIWGDAGNDRIESGAGVDLVNGGAGDDIITDSGDTGDFLKGEEGNDVIANSNGIDILMGGRGKDVVFVGVDSTEVFAGEGDDFVVGGDDADLLMGNEGDDWMEGGGGFDTTAGDNSELFFNSAIKGHDVMFAGGDEHDFDGESGDDIMVQGESVMRNEGMFGFDWAIFKGNARDGYADMRIPVFTTEEADILRNRFDSTEGLSGWRNNDTLIGDDRTAADGLAEEPGGATVAANEGVFFNDGLDQAGINRIAGLSSIVSVGANGVFEAGNILLGGAGSDTLQGNGGNDILDGDRWLNVRIRITRPDNTATPDVNEATVNIQANQLTTVDGLRHTFTQAQVTAEGLPPAWAGKSLFELLLTRDVRPEQMHIVREVVTTGVATTDVDTAVFSDVRANYSILRGGDGTLTVTHTTLSDPAIDDGTDTLRNMEQLRFADGTVSVALILNQPFDRLNIVAPNGDVGTLAAVFTNRDVNRTVTVQWQILDDNGAWRNVVVPADGTLATVGGVAGTRFTPSAANAGIELRVLANWTSTNGFGAQSTSSVETAFVGTAADEDLTGSTAPNVILGLVGDDDIEGDIGNDIIDGGDGDDRIDGGDGDDILRGNDGADILIGRTGNNTLEGGADDDQLSGGHGNDLIDGGTGVDTTLVSGTIEAYSFERNAAGAIVVTDNLGLEGDGVDTLTTVEQFQDAADDLYLLGANGTAGIDIVVGTTGANTLGGGAGDDLIFAGAGTDAIVWRPGDGRDFVDGGAGIDTFRVLDGSLPVQELTLAAARTAFPALTFRADTETVVVRGGVVIAELKNVEAVAINTLATGAPVITDPTPTNGVVSPTEGLALGVNIAGIQDANGVPAANQFAYRWQVSTDTGATWTDIAGAAAGNANFTPADAQAGNLLRVRVSFIDNAGNPEELFSAPTGVVGDDWNAIPFLLNTFNGTAGDDIADGTSGVFGAGANDTLNGNGGNDILNGAGGTDTLNGGAGDDRLDGGAGTDTAVFVGGIANFALGSNGTNLVVTDLTGAEGTDTLSTIETLRFAGTNYTVVSGSAAANANLNGAAGAAGSQAVFGFAGIDGLNGGAANDLLVGGQGDDTVRGDAGNDTIYWTAGDGRDLINGDTAAANLAGTTDTVKIVGDAAAETYRIYAMTGGQNAGLAASLGTTFAATTEIVITRTVGATTAVVAELDNIEEIVINGRGGGDTFIPVGTFAGTSLLTSTITLEGTEGDDTVDISALTSAHRIVFRSNGGHDTLVGTLRSDDVIELAPGATLEDYTSTTANGMTTLTNGSHTVTYASSGAPTFGTTPAPGGEQPGGGTGGGFALTAADLAGIKNLVQGRPAVEGEDDTEGATGVRNLSGAGNNLDHANYGAADQPFIRLTDAHYGAYDSATHNNALNPLYSGLDARAISNVLGAQEADLPHQANGSNIFFMAFGQYFDHGLDFLPKSAANGIVQIDQPGSGRTPTTNNPADLTRGEVSSIVDGVPQHLNKTSPYVDQNQAYGSHELVGQFLRETDGNQGVGARLLAGLPDPTNPDFNLLPTLRELIQHHWDADTIFHDPSLGATGSISFREYFSNFPITETRTGSLFNAAGAFDPEAVSAFASNFMGSGNALLLDTNPFISLLDHYVAGDGRANENVSLTAMHTIWARNHNFHVENLLEAGFDGSPEEVFQAAKMMNEAEYQRVVFDEFADQLIGGMRGLGTHGHDGYNPNVDARISHEFASAVYRVGHSLIGESLTVIGPDGQPRQVALFDAFLNPSNSPDVFTAPLPPGYMPQPGYAQLGANAILAGTATQPAEEVDFNIVNAVRNDLVRISADLFAFNVARGRDVGLGSLNQVRADLMASTDPYIREAVSFAGDLRPYASWEDFQGRNGLSDAVIGQFRQAYPDLVLATPQERAAFVAANPDIAIHVRPDGAEYVSGIDRVDLWVGGLAEQHINDGVVGQTFWVVLHEQFDRLQEGDRFYYTDRFDNFDFYENIVDGQNFSDIVARNTGLTGLQEDIFAVSDEDDGTVGDGDGDEDEDGDGDTTGGGDDEDEDDDDTTGGGGDDEDEDDDDTTSGGGDDEDEDGDGDTTGGGDDDDDEDEDDGDTTGGGDDDGGTDPVGCGGDDEDTTTPGTGGGTTGGGTTGGGTTGGGTTTPPAESTTNLVAGTANADVLAGTAGADTVLGLGGDDNILSGNGDDVVRGGDGNDFVDAGGGRDVVFGGAGDDDILAGSGADMVYGDGGADRILAGAGNDLVTAGSGNDDVMAGDGDDLIVAEVGDGDDTYWGDEVGGTAGIDTLDMSAITANITANLGTGLAGRGSVSSSQSGTDTLWGIENFVGGSGSDSITASDAVNVMDGGLGADTYRFETAAAANGDTLASFQPGDRVDLSAIDANQGVAGNQAFTLATGAAFTGVGQLLVTQETRADGDYTVIAGNTGGDATPEFRLSIKGTPAATAADFAL